MPRYSVERVEFLEPKQKFECARCDREHMVSPRGVYRRFRLRMSTPQGKEEEYCVVCASILTGRKQSELMREGREAAGAGRKPRA